MHILELKDVVKRFDVKGKRGKENFVEVLHGINMFVDKAEIIGLVGASGSGKSTIANLILRMNSITEGRLLYNEKDVTRIKGKDLKEYRRNVQLIFQDPYSSLDPTHNIDWHIRRPLKLRNTQNIEETITDILTDVSLMPQENFRWKMPHELSGGIRQRAYIARVLATSPSVLIADEPVSMLDASIRATILELFKYLRDKRGVSILYITHDLSTVSYLTDRLYIINDGRILESGKTGDIISAPNEEYTKKLIEAAPDPYRRINV
jgi:peptide/nickel transport system ATP-binding protein